MLKNAGGNILDGNSILPTVVGLNLNNTANESRNGTGTNGDNGLKSGPSTSTTTTTTTTSTTTEPAIIIARNKLLNDDNEDDNQRNRKKTIPDLQEINESFYQFLMGKLKSNNQSSNPNSETSFFSIENIQTNSSSSGFNKNIATNVNNKPNDIYNEDRNLE